jgi:asparagine synthase (glutamine-hydrolysing)
MGTICGIYHRKGDPVAPASGARMMELLQAFPHDAADSWRDGAVFLGNTNLHITPESKDEVLPRQAEQGAVILTADAIIDNRVELLAAFQIPAELADKTADSELILQAWLTWGEDCPRHLIGDYAFAIWDVRKQELFCARDHVGKRTLYEYLSEERFAFCTVIRSLLAVKGKRRELNEEWIANYFALAIAVNELDTSATVYQDIRQLPPAHTLKVSARGSEIKKYWDPLTLPPLKLRADEEYEAAFRQVYAEAVACRLRTSGEVGVMLSGGLDSGSVACIAAEQLAAAGKRLKSYTSVPFAAYQEWLGPNALADEREYVQAILEQCGNIDPAFCDAEGLTAYNTLDRLTALMEHPYKYIQNFCWVDAIAAQASRDGCRILLDGQRGNYTVSYGDLIQVVNSLLRSGKWLTARREIRAYATQFHRNYRSIWRQVLVMNCPRTLKRGYKRLFRGKQPTVAYEFAGPIHPQQAMRWRVDRRLKALGLSQSNIQRMTVRQVRKYLLQGYLFSQVGEVDVKLGLTYGIVRRDPTSDKRVMEFCLRLPPEQLVKDGVERSLIRRALVGILPDKVRLNQSVRGAQGADWIQRLRPEWPRLRDELARRLESPTLATYIDKGLVKETLAAITEYPSEDDYSQMVMLMIVLAMDKFLESISAEDD